MFISCLGVSLGPHSPQDRTCRLRLGESYVRVPKFYRRHLSSLPHQLPLQASTPQNVPRRPTQNPHPQTRRSPNHPPSQHLRHPQNHPPRPPPLPQLRTPHRPRPSHSRHHKHPHRPNQHSPPRTSRRTRHNRPPPQKRQALVGEEYVISASWWTRGLPA